MKWIKKLLAKFKKPAKVCYMPEFNDDGHFEGDMISKPKEKSKCSSTCC